MYNLIKVIKTEAQTVLTSSIPATGSEIPFIHPIQRITPNSGGSFTSTIDPTSRLLPDPASPFSAASSPLPGALSGEAGPWVPLVCCCWPAVRPCGLGGGRGGGGGSPGFWAGFGRGRGGDLSAGLIGGIRAIFGAEAGGDTGTDLVTGGSATFRMVLEDFWVGLVRWDFGSEDAEVKMLDVYFYCYAPATLCLYKAQV